MGNKSLLKCIRKCLFSELLPQWNKCKKSKSKLWWPLCSHHVHGLFFSLVALETNCVIYSWAWNVCLFLLKSYLPSCVWMLSIMGRTAEAEALNQLQIIGSKMSASKEKLPWTANSSQLTQSSLPRRLQFWNVITQEVLNWNARRGPGPVRIMTGSAEKQNQVCTEDSILYF